MQSPTNRPTLVGPLRCRPNCYVRSNRSAVAAACASPPSQYSDTRLVIRDHALSTSSTVSRQYRTASPATPSAKSVTLHCGLAVGFQQPARVLRYIEFCAIISSVGARRFEHHHCPYMSLLTAFQLDTVVASLLDTFVFV